MRLAALLGGANPPIPSRALHGKGLEMFLSRHIGDEASADPVVYSHANRGAH
jgi:hypothetical protein